MASDPPQANSRTPGPTDTWAEEFAKELADQLEAWASERESVLDKLDVRGARVARSLMRSLRVVARALAASAPSPEDEGRKEILARLVELRGDARRLMAEGADAVDPAGELDFDRESSPGRSDVRARLRLERARETVSPPELGDDDEKRSRG